MSVEETFNKSITKKLRLFCSDEEVANYIRWIIKSDTAKEYWTDSEKWISVKDRLPELKTYYDKEMQSNVIEVSIQVIATDGDDSWAESYSEDFGFHKSITHWMPFPNPPKIKLQQSK